MIKIIANAIDLLASSIQVYTGTIKSKSRILLLQIIQLLMQAISMAMTGGITGAISNILSIIRNYICYKGKFNIFWKAVFILASVVLTVIFNTQGILGYLPAVVCTIYIIFMDVKSDFAFKMLVTLTFIPWLVYHFVLQLYVASIFDLITIITNAITLIQMKRKTQK